MIFGYDSENRERLKDYYKKSHPYVVFLDHQFSGMNDYGKMSQIKAWLEERWFIKHSNKCIPIHNPHHEDYPDVIHCIDDSTFDYGDMCVWFRNADDALQFKMVWG